MGWTKRAGIVCLLLLGAEHALAGGSVRVNGARCVPGDPAIQADRYFVTGGSVNYKAGASGLVTLYCPAEVYCFGTNRHRLRVNYRDSDGAGNAVSVTAQVLRLSIVDGSFRGAVPGAQIFSNFSDETGATHQTTQTFEYVFDDSEYYYARVDMNRAPGTSHVATFYGLALECLD